ncbi:MAG: winged helix-turn-helix domain-containing protein [Pseudomonadota bacterium]
MDYMLNHWCVRVSENTLEDKRSNERFKIEPRSMEVLAYLIEKHGSVVSREAFIAHVWDGRITVEEVLTRCISDLRKVFEEDPRRPTYIKTVHKRGYKLLVEPVEVAQTLKEDQGSKPNTATWNFRKSLAVLTVAITVVFSALRIPGISLIKSEPAEEMFGDTFRNLAEVRTALSAPGHPIHTLVWKNEATGKALLIESKELVEQGTGNTRLLLRLTDTDKYTLWEVSQVLDSDQQRTRLIESLLEVLAQLQVFKEAPELSLLNPELRSTYRRALYLIDRRGRENLEKAITLLEEVIERNPSFVMGLVQKAYAIKTSVFYQPTTELRELKKLEYSLTLKQAGAVAPKHPVVASLSTGIKIKERNWSEHTALLEKAAEEFPACIMCVRTLAEHYLNLGYYRKAEALVVDHLEYFPLSVTMQSFLGQIYNMQGSVEGAKHQVKTVKAISASDGSDFMAMEINIAMNEGDLAAFEALSTAMVRRHPAYSLHKAAMDAQISGDLEELRLIVASMPKLDFNQALTVGNFTDLLERIHSNIDAGQLRDLRLIHGWLNSEAHLSKLYGAGLLALKNHPDISELFDQIGLFEFWDEQNRWPDYCRFDQYLAHRPDFCPSREIAYSIDS